jgi:hypothetical protein
MNEPERPSDPNLLPEILMGRLVDGATRRQYIGQLADSDAKSLISRTYNTTKEEASAVDRIVGSPTTLYSSHGDFVRHAIWELIQAYVEDGWPDNYIPDVTAHIKNMRESAQRLRIRQEFNDILIIYEASLSDGLATGDFELVSATFNTLQGYLDRTPDEHWKQYLRRVVLRSSVMKAAIDALYDMAHENGVQEYQVEAEKWLLWLEGLADG